MIGDQSDILKRLKEVIPPWFGTNTPIMDIVLSGPAKSFSGIYALIQYALLQTRIATATDGWLDLIARDFFALGFQRRKKEPDEIYSKRIQEEILRARGTRDAVSKAVFDLTGIEPLIFEPARIADTGALGVLRPTSFALSGYTQETTGITADSTIITADSTTLTADSGSITSRLQINPGFYGSYKLPCQFFITAYRPLGVGIPGVAGYSSFNTHTGLGGYGSGTIMYADSSLNSGPVTDAEIYATIARTVVSGVTAWTRIRPFSGGAASATLLEWQPVSAYYDMPIDSFDDTSHVMFIE